MCSPSFFCEKNPASKFNTYRQVGIFQGKASLTYIDKVFTIYQEGKIQRREEVPEEQSAAYLERYFGLRG